MTPARLYAALAVVACMALPAVSSAAPSDGILTFDTPVLLTTTEGVGGFEPTLAVDAHDNVWVTAHRSYTPAVPDAGARAGARTAAWLWVSPDGKSFANPPGLDELRSHEQHFGLEGDLATDAAGNVHFADLGGASTTYTKWKSSGAGRYKAERSTPNAGVFTVDRPFIAANGKTVVLAVNDIGASPLAPAATSEVLAGKAQGQYALYVSHDGGATFPLTGFRASESKFCRPHVSRRNPQVIMAVCSAYLLDSLDDDAGDDGALVFSSQDGGTTWSKQLVVNTGVPSAATVFPSVAETRDGRLHFLIHRTADKDGVTLASSDLLLSSSSDAGRTWSTPRVINPEPGLWQLTSIAADPRTGRLGLAGYHRKNASQPWDFRAAVFSADAKDITSSPVPGGVGAYPASELAPPGEFTQAAFDSRGRLNITFSVRELPVLQPAANGMKMVGSSKVFFARQR